MATPELSGISVVGAGSFNPAIIHPRWLADRNLIRENEAEHAMRQGEGQQLIVSPQIAIFVADWLSVQVTQGQAIFSTVDMGRETDLRDLALGVLQLLPETPISAVGINADTHFRVASDEAWHAFGDKFLPKEFWKPLFEEGDWQRRKDGQVVGMRSMSVEVTRADERTPGHVRVEVAPSSRITPNGVFVGINAHFQLKKSPDDRPSAGDATRILADNWDPIRALEKKLLARLLEAI